MVNFVDAVSAALFADPFAGRLLAVNPPESAQEVAFWLVQVRLTMPPELTDWASLASVTTGPGDTFRE
jgi:hypothetical protein